MKPSEIKKHIMQQPFEPFAVVTSSGEKYPVHHPEMAQITPSGALYVFQPATPKEIEEGFMVRSPDILSILHVTAIEPIRQKSA